MSTKPREQPDVSPCTDVQGDLFLNLFVQVLDTEQQKDGSGVGGGLAGDTTVHLEEQVAAQTPLVQHSGQHFSLLSIGH